MIYPGKTKFNRHLLIVVAAWTAPHALAQDVVLLEDFEFATSDAAAEAGIIDKTDFANEPAIYNNGECDIPPSPCDEVAEGLFSIGTEAAFCLQFCDPGSRIGFRRLVQSSANTGTCAVGGSFMPLANTYGDPMNPGAQGADYPLSELTLLVAAYGDGAFADGPTGTNLWMNLVDCEGEIFEFINLSEASLYSELWTLDVAMGVDIVRLSEESLDNGEPIGDGLLTEIAAIEFYIQDDDNPPTSFGKWYVDDVRMIEPAPVGGDVPAVSTWGYISLVGLLLTAGTLTFRRRRIVC